MSVTETYFLVPHLLRDHDHMTEIGFASLVLLRLRIFGAQSPSELVIARMA